MKCLCKASFLSISLWIICLFVTDVDEFFVRFGYGSLVRCIYCILSHSVDLHFQLFMVCFDEYKFFLMI